jgi:hypothetical protein
MTEFKEGDLVQVPAHRARYSYHTGEVGLVVELRESAHRRWSGRSLVGVVWPHTAGTRWYCISDLVKVTEDD